MQADDRIDHPLTLSTEAICRWFTFFNTPHDHALIEMPHICGNSYLGSNIPKESIANQELHKKVSLLTSSSVMFRNLSLRSWPPPALRGGYDGIGSAI